MNLSLEQYTREYLTKRDVIEKMNSGITEVELTEEERVLLKTKLPSNYYTYRLRGVVLSRGGLDAGHYGSIIEDRESFEWYEFNDTYIKKHNISLLKKDLFGCTFVPPYKNNIPLLIYERIDHFHMKIIKELPDEILRGGIAEELKAAKVESKLFLEVKSAQDILKCIAKEDTKEVEAISNYNVDFIRGIWNVNEIIKQNDLKVVKKLNLQWSLFSNEEEYGKSLERQQFFAMYTFIVLLRTNTKNLSYELLDKLRSIAAVDLGFCVWLLETFTHPLIIQEFFVDCSARRSRFIIASLLNLAFTKVFTAEKKRIRKYINTPKHFFDKLENNFEVKSLEGIVNGVYMSVDNKKHLPYCLIFLYNISIYASGLLVPDLFFVLSTVCRKSPILLTFLYQIGLLRVLLEFIIEGSIEESKRPIVIRNDLNIGFQQLLNKTEEDLILNKVSKHKKQFRFIIELLSQLIRTDKVKLTIEENKLMKLFMTTAGIQRLLTYGDSNVAINEIAKIFSHLAFENKEFSNNCLEFLLLNIPRIKYTELPLYLISIKALLLIKDKLQNERVRAFITNYLQFTKKDLYSSYLTYSYLTDLFIEIGLKVESVKEMIQKNSDKFIHVQEWLKRFCYPIANDVSLIIIK